MENMQKQGEMHCDTEIVILIGISEYIFKMLLENGIGYKGAVKKAWSRKKEGPRVYYKP